MYAFMCIHDVCIVRFYVFIRVSMRMYVFMPILCCVFKPVYCRCFRGIYIEYKTFICLCVYCLWINMCNNFELYNCLGIFGCKFVAKLVKLCVFGLFKTTQWTYLLP